VNIVFRFCFFYKVPSSLGFEREDLFIADTFQGRNSPCFSDFPGIRPTRLFVRRKQNAPLIRSRAKPLRKPPPPLFPLIFVERYRSVWILFSIFLLPLISSFSRTPTYVLVSLHIVVYTLPLFCSSTPLSASLFFRFSYRRPQETDGIIKVALPCPTLFTRISPNRPVPGGIRGIVSPTAWSVGSYLFSLEASC